MIRHVLIVDDDAAVAASLSQAIHALGRKPMVASTASQARQLLTRQPVDLVITDWRMPIEDGLSLAGTLSFADVDLPIVLCTAYASTDTLATAKRAGCWGLLTKPVSLEALEAVLSQSEAQQFEQRDLLARTATRTDLLTSDDRRPETWEAPRAAFQDRIDPKAPTEAIAVDSIDLPGSQPHQVASTRVMRVSRRRPASRRRGRALVVLGGLFIAAFAATVFVGLLIREGVLTL